MACGGIAKWTRTRLQWCASDFESGAFSVPKKTAAKGVIVAVFYSTTGSQSNKNSSDAEK